MIPYLEYPPHAALAPYVACYWCITSPLPLVNRILPDGCTDIVVTDNIKFVGAMRHAFVSQLIPHEVTVGIRFKPGGSAAFFRLPLHELTDDEVELSDLWGRCAYDLTEQVAITPNARAKIAHLEAALLCRLDQLPSLNSTLQQAVHTVRQANGGITVTDLRTTLALSERQLERCFHQNTGLSPRYFARVTRFRQVLDLLQRPALSLTEVAYRTGYYDQSHFIHDFKSLAGLTPRDYRREQQDVGFLQFPAVTA